MIVLPSSLHTKMRHNLAGETAQRGIPYPRLFLYVQHQLRCPLASGTYRITFTLKRSRWETTQSPDDNNSYAFGLGKQTPAGRIPSLNQCAVISRSRLGGLHHRYDRAAWYIKERWTQPG
jgi:hypothetical protein